MAAEPHTPFSEPSTSTRCAGLIERQAEGGGKQEGDMKIPNTPVSDVIEPLSSPSLPLPPSPTAPVSKVEAELERQSVEEKVEENVEERKRDVNEQPGKKPFWLVDDKLPPMM